MVRTSQEYTYHNEQPSPTFEPVRSIQRQNGNGKQPPKGIPDLTARVQNGSPECHLLLFVKQTQQKDGARKELSSALYIITAYSCLGKAQDASANDETGVRVDETGAGADETPGAAHAADVDAGPFDFGDNHVGGDLKSDIACVSALDMITG
jgi:hypothetical protein